MTSRLHITLTALVLCCATSFAATYYWSGIDGGNWADNASWEEGDFPKADGDVAIFSNAVDGFSAVGINAAVTVGVIEVRGPGADQFQFQPGATLYFQNGGNPAEVIAGDTSKSVGASLRGTYVLLDDLICSAAVDSVDLNTAADFSGPGTISLYGPSVGSLRCAAPSYTNIVYVYTTISIYSETVFTNAQYIWMRGDLNTDPAVDTIVTDFRLDLGTWENRGLKARNNKSATYTGTVETHRGATVGYNAASETTLAGLLTGTGLFETLRNGTSYFTGSVAPGFSVGTLTLVEGGSALEFGAAADQVELLIEDGDLVELTSMDAALDLGNIDVTFLNTTAPGTTNWFLTADGGIANTLNSVAYTNSLAGMVIYDSGNNRVGAVVVPEPALVLAGVAAMLALLRRRMK